MATKPARGLDLANVRSTAAPAVNSLAATSAPIEVVAKPQDGISVANVRPVAGPPVAALDNGPPPIEVVVKPASGVLVTNAQAATDLPVDASSAAPALPTIGRQSVTTKTVPASSHAPRRHSNEQPQPVRVSESARGLDLHQQRKLTQAEARERSLQMALLTADLTRAAQARDQPETERLLSDMESKAGVGSNYSLNMRGYVALVNGQYAEAEELLRLVLARDRTDADAAINMAVVESKTGRIKQARRRLERLALAHPDDDRIGVILKSLARAAADGP